jgi:hypothetical protein
MWICFRTTGLAARREGSIPCRRTPARQAAAATLALCAACLPAAAAAAPTVALKAALLPERLGGGTTIKFALSIAFPRREKPLPVTLIELRYPAHLGIATSGLGLATCSASTLEQEGPEGCPPNSVMGYGSGIAGVPFPADPYVREAVRLTVFMAPLHEGRLGLLFFAFAGAPVRAELVFPGALLPSAAPFGGNLVTNVPLVPSWFEGPDVVLTRFSTTLGPSGITYWEYSRGRYIPYHPRGIRLPRTCPRGGFPFEAALTFEDGARADAHAAVGCPRLGSHNSRRLAGR